MIALWKETGFDKVLRTAWENGEYVVESIDDSLEFKPLSELLSRNNKNKSL